MSYISNEILCVVVLLLAAIYAGVIWFMASTGDVSKMCVDELKSGDLAEKAFGRKENKYSRELQRRGVN